jgi:PAS domain S-box-containing protein
MDETKIQILIKSIESGDALTSSEKRDLLKLLKGHLNEEFLSSDNNLIKAIAKASEKLKNSLDLFEALKVAFEIIGRATNVDRVYYFENSIDDESRQLITNQKVEWVAEDMEPQIDNPDLQNIPLSIYSDLEKSLKIGKPFSAIVDQIEEEGVKKLLESQGIKSILMFPVMVNRNFFGFIGFDDCTNKREWSEAEVHILQSLISQISQFIEKNEIKNLLDRTYRQAKIGTWEMDLETDTFHWSSITKEIFDLGENEIPDRILAERAFFRPEDRKKILKAVEETTQTGKPYDFEVEVLTSKGKKKWVRDTGQAEFQDGKAVRIHGTVQDIDERKRAELESEKNKMLLEAITGQTDVSILVRNKNGEHLFVNEKWKRVFGFEKIDVVGKKVNDLFDKSIADHITKKDHEIINSGKQQLFEERVLTIDGYRYFMVNKFPLKGIQGMEEAVGGIGTDITELKEAEAKIQDAEQKLRDIVEHSTNLFYSHDTNHVLVYLSPQSKLFFGYEPEEAKKRWTEFTTDNPVNQIGFEITQRAIDTGEPQPPYEVELKRADGAIIWVEVNEAPLVKNGKTELITGSLTDITDRKRAQAEIKKSLKEKETLLAEIHHRVKNNLAVVASMMQMQAHLSDDKRLGNDLIESVLRIKSMANIHEHLYQSKHFADLDFAMNLKTLVTDVINTMQVNTELKIEFNCEKVLLNVSQAIPCSLIVNEVVTNIIKHAYDERDHGNVNVALSQADTRIKLEITDDGNGLPEDFSPESSNTLGLQLIKTLSEQLGANYQYLSEDIGCTFLLEFKKE